MKKVIEIQSIIEAKLSMEIKKHKQKKQKKRRKQAYFSLQV